MPDPGAVVLEDLITVLALEAERLVLVRYPDVLPERPLVAATLPAVLAEVALACRLSNQRIRVGPDVRDDSFGVTRIDSDSIW